MWVGVAVNSSEHWSSSTLLRNLLIDKLGYPWSLLFQHNIDSWQRAALSPFTYIERHALLRDADFLPEIDRIMHQSISPDHLRAIVDMIPDDWLRFDLPDDASPEEAASRVAELRHFYSQYLIDRLSNSKIFVDHAINTRREKFAL